MTAPVIANPCPVAAMLIDPTTGVAYRPGFGDTPSAVPIANALAPLATVLIDPVSGQPYAT